MSDKPEVFLSWAGDRAEKIAKILASIIPEVIDVKPPFFSRDMRSGTAWHEEIIAKLRSANFGIAICTPENRNSEWMQYEAGALSMRSLKSLQVICIGFDPPIHLASPLQQRQAPRISKESLKNVLIQMSQENLKEDTDKLRFNTSFDAVWKRVGYQILEQDSREIIDENERSDRAVLENTLDLVAGLWQREFSKDDKPKFLCRTKDGSLEPREIEVTTSVTNQMVRSVQAALRSKGYSPGPSDNVMGNETKKALVEFQKDNDLPVGQLDFETLKALGVNF